MLVVAGIIAVLVACGFAYRAGVTAGEVRMEARIRKVINEEAGELADKLYNRPDPFGLRDKPSRWRRAKAGKP